jgi:hypothetical protein
MVDMATRYFHARGPRYIRDIRDNASLSKGIDEAVAARSNWGFVSFVSFVKIHKILSLITMTDKNRRRGPI